MSASLLIEEPPLIVLPKLAERVGLNEAIALQQLHFLTLTYLTRVVESDGKRWLKADLQFWIKQFPFWSESTIKRTWANLATAGLVHRSRGREANTYAIDRLALSKVAGHIDLQRGSVSADETGQNDPSPCKGDLGESGEKTGAADGDPALALPGLEASPTPSPPPKPAEELNLRAIQEVWDHHLALFGDRMRIKALTAPRERTLRKALKAVEGDTALLKRASDGLQSYRKANPSGSQDVSIDTIFATGPHSSRSLTDQIEWWASQAESDGRSAVPGVPSALHDKINRRRLLVVEMHQKPNDTALRESGQQALAWLKKEAKLEPVIEDGLVAGWRSL